MQSTPSLNDRAIALHAAAFASDPFAAARMSLFLRNGTDRADKVREEALRIINDRKQRIDADFKAWCGKLGMTPGQAWAKQHQQQEAA